MIVVGDKFKLKDKELLVTNLSGTGNIIFKILNDNQYGIMSFEDFNKNCIKIDSVISNTVKKERTWTKWHNSDFAFYDMDGNLYQIPIKCRHNGLRVEMKTDWDEEEYGYNLRARSSCHPDDNFSYKIGQCLARARLYAKLAQKYADELKEGL